MTRPAFHFTPASGWVNDPYGVTWRDGRYHLFFQHVPGAAAWDVAQHWGHAVSDDLLTWRELPVVLSPDEHDDGIWSGSVVDADGGRIFYTSVRADAPELGRVRVARPLDTDWTRWAKQDGTVVEPPAELDVAHFRDPFVLHDGATWRMVVGAGLRDGTAAALTWTSSDLETWTYDGVLASRHGSERDPVWTGTVWECPQLLRVDDAWVLVVSVWAGGETQYVAAAVGDLVDGRFAARAWQRLTRGAHYAASAFRDADGRPCLIHWLRGAADPEGRWVGAHSVPHVLRLDDDRIVLEPHPAVADRAVRDGERLVLVDGPVVEEFGPDGVTGYVSGDPSRGDTKEA